MTHGWKYTNTDIVETEDIVKSPNLQKNNITATTDPTVSNDSSEGYSQGSFWINHTGETIWLCSDASVGAAVWFQVSGSGGGGVDFSNTDVDTGTEIVDTFDPTGDGAASWDVFISDGTNIRQSTVLAHWDDIDGLFDW